MDKEIQVDWTVCIYVYSTSSESCCFASWKISPSVQGSLKVDSKKERRKSVSEREPTEKGL